MNAATDFTALKTRQMAAWGSGDYAVIGTTLQIVGEQLAEACDLRCDERVLDVAAGNGNATLAAARRGCLVTSTDYVSSLLERGAERARAEHLDVKFQVADVEALPFGDASFDAVLSTFGVMFAPDHAFIAAQVAGLGQLLADNLQCGANDGVVAAPPGGHLARLEGGEIGGCVHGAVLRVRLWCRDDPAARSRSVEEAALCRAVHCGAQRARRPARASLRPAQSSADWRQRLSVLRAGMIERLSASRYAAAQSERP